MADIHGSPGDPGLQMPQAANSGSAPVPYAGPGLSPEPPPYAADLGPVVDHPLDMVHAVTNLGTTEDPSATSLSPAAVSGDAPYYPGPLSPINAAGDPDAGGRDDVAGDVASAVANAQARWNEFQSDILPQGSTYGDLMQFPPIGQDPGAGVGNTLPTQGFYDPPRGYGGTEGAPAYGGSTGDEPPPGYQGVPQ